MVRVSCFSNPSHHHRSKVSKLFRGVTQASLSSNTKRDSKIPSTTNADQNRSPPLEGCWRSEDSSSYTENNESLKIKKSQSLGDLLEKENRYTFDDISVAKMQDYVTHSFDVINHIGGCNTSSSIRLYHEKKENCPTLSTDFTDPHQHDCLTSIGNAEWLNENQCGFGDDLLADHLVNLEVPPSCYRPVLTRSQSLNLQMNSPNVIEGLAEPGPHSRSFQNLCSANGNKCDFAEIDMLHLETTSHTELAELDRASNIGEARVSPGHCEDALEECVQSNVSGGCNEMRDEHMNGKCWQMRDLHNSSVDEISHCYVDSGVDCHDSEIGLHAATDLAKRDEHLIEEPRYGDQSHHICNSEDCYQEVDQREDAADDTKLVKAFQHENCHNCNLLSPAEFNITRIENWTSQIDIPSDLVVEEGM